MADFKHLIQTIKRKVFPVSWFHDAVLRNRLDKIDYYLKHFIHADNINILNPETKDGYNALHYACWNQNLVLMEKLLKAGADPNAINGKGQTALMMVIQKPRYIVSQLENVLIVSHMPHPEINPSIPAMVKILIEAGADLNLKDSKGDNSLSLAIQTQYFELAQDLVYQGVDIFSQNQENRTPLSYIQHFDFHKASLAKVVEAIIHTVKCSAELEKLMRLIPIYYLREGLMDMYMATHAKLTLEASLTEKNFQSKAIKI